MLREYCQNYLLIPRTLPFPDDGRNGTVQCAPNGTFNITYNNLLQKQGKGIFLFLRSPFPSIVLDPAEKTVEKPTPLQRLFKQKSILKSGDEAYRPSSVTFSSDGQHVVSCSPVPYIAGWETNTGRMVSRSNLLNSDASSQTSNTVPSECGTIPWYPAEFVSLSAHGTRMCTGAHLKAVQSPGHFADRDRVVKVWDVREGSFITSIEHKNDAQPVTGAALSPDGSHLLTASYGCLRLWNASTGKLTNEVAAHFGSISPVSFSPNGAHAVSVGQVGNIVTIWDADTLELVSGPHGDIYNKTVALGVVAMLPSGDKLAMGFIDGTIIVMDVKTEEFSSPKMQFNGHTSWVTSIAFSPNGQWMISGSGDGSIRLWIVENGKPMSLPLKGMSGINSVAISPDGDTIASSSLDRCVRTWARQPIDGEC